MSQNKSTDVGQRTIYLLDLMHWILKKKKKNQVRAVALLQ